MFGEIREALDWVEAEQQKLQYMTSIGAEYVVPPVTTSAESADYLVLLHQALTSAVQVS